MSLSSCCFLFISILKFKVKKALYIWSKHLVLCYFPSSCGLFFLYCFTLSLKTLQLFSNYFLYDCLYTFSFLSQHLRIFFSLNSTFCMPAALSDYVSQALKGQATWHDHSQAFQRNCGICMTLGKCLFCLFLRTEPHGCELGMAPIHPCFGNFCLVHAVTDIFTQCQQYARCSRVLCQDIPASVMDAKYSQTSFGLSAPK